MAEARGGSFVAPTPTGLRCTVRVTPRGARNAIQGVSADRALLRVTVTAPPQDGAANDAVIRLLAKSWRVPRTSITVRSGAAARTKVLHVAGDPAELRDRLETWEKGLHAG